ncbi:MAG: DPP IV N-terminal domain-containing protein [candidate division KSB1 bacterium]|nr:DPP IV N-terminal domain-containing protein [candidate division KSB1 bacterium]MDZ7302398.1 DPP IV N-terminal domain-containing protein [candidate division KSB1 bacterium]MDZ7311601.1 DPP IV N-terminal domain-containing protein [candidate division KSB1 bacterium]
MELTKFRAPVHFMFVATILALAFSLHAQEKKRLTFEQIFKNAEPRITRSLPNIIGWADDNHYLEMKKKDGDKAAKVYAIDVVSGEEKVYRDLEQHAAVVDSGITVANPASYNEGYTRLIYVKDKDLYFLDTQKKEFKRLTQTVAEEKNPTLSPDGNYVAFTRDNNLFSIEVNTGKENQYTTDGTEVVYNGWASWVYYEEILGRPTRYRAFWWSPDSKNLAFYRFDDSNVPVFPLYNADGVHGTLENTRYPKVGDPNPEVRIGIVPVSGGKVVWADFNEKHDQYFGTPFWTPDGKQLLVQWMNRGQDTLKIYAIDPATGTKKEIYAETQNSWVEWFESIHFLRDQSFLVKSDKDGWSHLYWHGSDGKLKNRITQGKWAVTGVVQVDEKNRHVYFTARKEATTRTDLYRVKLNGKELTRLTFGDFTHNTRLSPAGTYFITTYSNLATPPKMALCQNTGAVIKELGDSKTEKFAEYELAKTELFRVPTPDGYHLPVLWTLPLNFDANKKYPVLISVYGGPDAGTVSDSWPGIRSQWLAQEGMIQVAIDHRASGHFGKAGVAQMHRNLGKWEMHDYIEVAKWLRARPFVDTTKICITGGSYGGYVTCMALTYGADYFTHGIALFSVTDWKLYDTHYTERYMDTPAENPEGYKNSSVLTHAGKYKGLLRIVHGTMDDNVHMQNSIQLVSALQDKGKHFEFMLYPGERHGWGGPKGTHLRNENYRFYYQHLLEKEFPESLFGSAR